MEQIVYYFYSALRLACDEKTPISFSVPSGNFGDIYAGFLAKKMGLNINKLIIATNSNDILTRFIENNDYSKKDLEYREKMVEYYINHFIDMILESIRNYIKIFRHIDSDKKKRFDNAILNLFIGILIL
jgi:threonine synthase